MLMAGAAYNLKKLLKYNQMKRLSEAVEMQLNYFISLFGDVQHLLVLALFTS